MPEIEASGTKVLKSPQPFVLQSNLNELKAFTSQPQSVLSIYSELHQNIQDQFNEAGIKITSPHYTSLRDGNRIAIPEQYISKSYREPGLAFAKWETVTGSETGMCRPRRSLRMCLGRAVRNHWGSRHFLSLQILQLDRTEMSLTCQN